MLSNPSPDTLVSYLLEAPKVMREMSTVQWQFLDAPPDGSIFLTWQPMDYLQNNFASDGYVWADVEQPFNSDVRGYVSGSCAFRKRGLMESEFTNAVASSRL
jgi:hypothetical protein